MCAQVEKKKMIRPLSSSPFRLTHAPGDLPFHRIQSKDVWFNWGRTVAQERGQGVGAELPRGLIRFFVGKADGQTAAAAAPACTEGRQAAGVAAGVAGPDGGPLVQEGRHL